jgi:anti-sigma factor RsiW
LKIPNNSNLNEHPENLLLRYVENDLKPEERSAVEQHMKDCSKCAESVRTLEGVTRRLRDNAEDVICPEASHLYEFVRTGTDPVGKMARHLAHCTFCREEVSIYRDALAASLSQPVPQYIRETFEQNYPAPKERTWLEQETLWSKLQERLRSFFRQPVLVLGTAFVVVLMMAVLYPREGTEPLVALSGVTWGETGRKWTTMNISPEQGKPRVAVAILLKGFKEQLPQERVDELYNSLEPSPELKKRFEFINPAQLQTLATTDQSRTVRSEGLPEHLSRKIGPIKVVMITVSPELGGFSIESRLVDSETGKILAQALDKQVSPPDLSSKLRQSAFALLGKLSNK